MKTYFPVVPKRKPSPGGLNSSESCPYCKQGFVDFMDISGNGRVLGCYLCGGVFVSREARDHDRQFKAEQMADESTGAVEFSEPEQSTPPDDISEDDSGAFLLLGGPTEGAPEEGVDHGLVNPLAAKCGKVMATETKRKQHEKMCKKCREIAKVE